ncbi:hypothetical protein THAOC_21703 [Thalassiosira oceanica]|uniref:SCD domain-containing protein n=1 Tax=Thalassiosira oceanica TaxID=159749 RepID=K0SBC6_THAOC|nr:hypothetical protein THAOC_21703 [Thalassiosira oceanica]|eukprot:EJK58196.1 hypothetical protein THAOC_21703 [Thalassiosira oceanica]
MATRSTSAPRRSGRSRKAVESVYTEAEAEAKKQRDNIGKQQGGAKKGQRKVSMGKRKPVHEEEEDIEADDHSEEDVEEEEDEPEESSEEEDESDGDDGNDEDFTRGKKKASAKKTTIKMKKSPKNKSQATLRSKKTTGAARIKHTALSNLAKNTLEQGATPGVSSLVAGLLHAYRPSKATGEPLEELSEYTPNLTTLARKVIQVHNEHSPNQAQLALLNLISEDGNKEVILEDLDNDQWAQIVTDLVDELRHFPDNHILLCADPLGAVHQSLELKLSDEERALRLNKLDGYDPKKGVSVGQAEYRKIYGEFWYILGRLALTEGGLATESQIEGYMPPAEFESQEAPVPPPVDSSGPVVRLDAELIRGLITRLLELTPVGQPDVRAGTCLAVFSMAHAILDQSSMLVKKMDVAQRQYEAAAKARKSPKNRGGDKAESLKLRVDSLKRTIEDLEEVVLGPVIQGLFVNRYRDSNEHIRAMCLESLSRMTLQRPDLFLNDKYLKYFGWMMHDKFAVVRKAAYFGILAPFEAIEKSKDNEVLAGYDSHLMVDKIDLSMLDNVVAKFIATMSDAVMDVSVDVQEVAMKLMLALLNNGFLDEHEGDEIWDKVNARALAADAPPTVQKDSLYFILDQLEAFDDGGENTKASPNERKRAQQLDSIASYAAHAMTNNDDIPVDKILIEAADNLVRSLREMPEHKGLVTDWSAMLRAIKDDKIAATASNVTAGDKANVAKQRVLVRMLACAAREEVGEVASKEFLTYDEDPDTVGEQDTKKGKKPSKDVLNREHENLTVALLKALPSLLIQFKGDNAIVPELASLPRFLIPTVLSLPQRKQDFMSLIKNLSEIYLSSSDNGVLDRTARSLVSLTRGDHARVSESKAQLRKVATELRDRIVDNMASDSDNTTIATSATSYTSRSKRKSGRKRTPASSPGSIKTDKTSLTSDDTNESGDADTEYAISINLKRLKILAKKCDLSTYFDEKDGTNQIELLCNYVSDGLKTRLRACKPVDLRINADEETTVAKLIDSPELLGAIGKSVSEGVELILLVIGWMTNAAQVEANVILTEEDMEDLIDDEDLEDNDEDDVDEYSDHPVLRLRNRLVSTLEQCYAQYIPLSEDHDDDETSIKTHSKTQHDFSVFVQLAACRVTADLRTLFPQELEHAASPLLRAMAFKDAGRLIGAYVRFLESKNDSLRDNDKDEPKEGKKLSQALLFPISRSLVANWKTGNRREAGEFLRHISSSGPTAADICGKSCSVMKKIDSVRMLESQMASLRESHVSWVDDTPAMDSDRPSEEELDELEQMEKEHKDQFGLLEQRASVFSQALGAFGKLSNKSVLGPALSGFMREGMRYAFSNHAEEEDEDSCLGDRLSFLLLLGKYATWIKKDKKAKGEVQTNLDELESEIREHEDFDSVEGDDVEALKKFREIMGFKAFKASRARGGSSIKSGASSIVSAASKFDDEDEDENMDDVSELPSPAPSTGNKSAGSSRASSARSRKSKAMPTLAEADVEESPEVEDDEEDLLASPVSDSARLTKRSASDDLSAHGSSDEDEMIGGSPAESKRQRRR